MLRECRLPDHAREKGTLVMENIQIQVFIRMFKHVETVLSVNGQINNRLVSCLCSFLSQRLFPWGKNTEKKKLNHIVLYGSAVNNIYMVINNNL